MKFAVVIPAYRVREQILGVVAAIPVFIDMIFVVDDACPEGSGDVVLRQCTDARIRVLRHDVNQGVGGAMVTGYREALRQGADVVAKIDGDGQMDPKLLERFLKPILDGRADYTKGNRFFQLQGLKRMPWVRLIGNACLSLMTKIMSGYWNIMDPTNGYTAIHATALRAMALDRLSRRYFFESDCLFQLSLARAVVVDVPMEAVYGNERSNLSVLRTMIGFPPRYAIRLVKRIFYSYFLRDFNLGTLQITAAAICGIVGGVFGTYHYWKSVTSGIPATSGTVMLAALPLILGFQSLIGALQFDVLSAPTKPISSAPENHRPKQWKVEDDVIGQKR